MTLTTENRFVPFSDYYNSLVAHELTEHERLLALIRDEIGVRKRVEKEEQRHFADVLHVAGVMIGDKKVRLGIGKRTAKAIEAARTRYPGEDAASVSAKNERPAGGCGARTVAQVAPHRSAAARAVNEAIWFPAAEPLRVTAPTRALVPGYPYRAVHALFEEEAELRRWLCGVEARLRQQMEEECHFDSYVSASLKEIEVLEKRSRARLEREQIEVFSALRNRLFYSAPPEYFRSLVVHRYGATPSAIEEYQRELTLPEEEAQFRLEIEAQEETAFVSMFEYLQRAYDVQLFKLNHLELVERDAIVEEEIGDLYPLVLHSARGTYGLLYEHCPAVFLNISAARLRAPAMHELAVRFKQISEERARNAHQELHSSNRAQYDEEARPEVGEAVTPDADVAEEYVSEEKTASEAEEVAAAPATMDSAELEEPASLEEHVVHATVSASDLENLNVKYLATEEKTDEWLEL